MPCKARLYRTLQGILILLCRPFYCVIRFDEKFYAGIRSFCPMLSASLVNPFNCLIASTVVP